MKRFILRGLSGSGMNVSLEKTAKGFEVTIDGQKEIITAVDIEQARRLGYAVQLAEGQIYISTPSHQRAYEFVPDAGEASSSDGALGQAELKALFPGKVVKVLVQEKSTVEAGELVLVMESMKMEYPYRAPKKIVIDKVLVKEGDTLAKGQLFFEYRE